MLSVETPVSPNTHHLTRKHFDPVHLVSNTAQPRLDCSSHLVAICDARYCVMFSPLGIGDAILNAVTITLKVRSPYVSSLP
jgi:hypothetical protein